MTSTLSAQWNDDRDGVLIEGFHAQVVAGMHKGRSTGSGGLKKDGWHNLLKYFNSTLGLNYQKSQLQSRWTILKKRHAIFKALKTHPEFSWDNEHNLPVAPQAVWNDFTAKYPDALQYRSAPLTFFAELDAILSGDVVPGDNGDSSDTDEDTPRRSATRKRPAHDLLNSNIQKASRIDALVHAESSLSAAAVAAAAPHHQTIVPRHHLPMHATSLMPQPVKHDAPPSPSSTIGTLTPLERALKTFFILGHHLPARKKLQFSQYLATGPPNGVVLFNCIDDETKWLLINDVLSKDS
ncbi:hypothetical protein SPRG_07701 [Saprolegnia parasitica CBS 223.65]|uniref:Myb/SANT-like domain-containing protein n=1 Tax=Saprolegnia parasitica (strain CBS 223.65) TaxID=695850 RepID=A0A067C8Z3_SAPPC|nr:hypothetical protein SPRG_07701 [Saprolegnia parasitica CBS 223.65]KDO26988.1 hypothetical protein SPRG_07701 [Saprolegnia parasitica CBS 223.65]|eukprot:XP_012202369.1 hypothetical protein SPRG_07701 [Saprolegnia parasitica CBS 223.65]